MNQKTVTLTPLFPTTEWAWDISKDSGETIRILHPSGNVFISQVKLNRQSRLEGNEQKIYDLNLKDVDLIAYIMDYFINKATTKLNRGNAMIVAGNLVSAYRFRLPLGPETIPFEDQKAQFGDYRKFGEHKLFMNGSELNVFVIGKEGKNEFYAVTLSDTKIGDFKIPKLELLKFPRSYFRQSFDK